MHVMRVPAAQKPPAGDEAPGMDELLRDFLTETGESLDLVDAELVRFEQEPNNGQILGNIFRLVHTIKGTCGFLGLPRLETLTHAAENLIGKFRDGMPVTAEAVTVILSTLDRIKTILDGLEANAQEPAGRRRRTYRATRPSGARGRMRAPQPAPPEAPAGRGRRRAAERNDGRRSRRRAAAEAQRKARGRGERKTRQSIRSASASIRSIG